MNILNYTREQIEQAIELGLMRKESLKHYDICKALSDGKTQADVAEAFELSDSRVTRFIKDKKCPDCGNSRRH